MTQFFVDRVNGVFTVNGFNLLDLLLNSFLCCCKLRQICREAWNLNLIGQVILDCVRQYEVSVSQTLHQSRCSQTVGSVIREVSFADSKQTRDRGHQFIINPDTTHCIVNSGEYHHRSFVWVLVGDFFVHVEEVTITGANHIFT